MDIQTFVQETQRQLNSIERRLNVIGAGAGQANTASNIGAGGVGLYQQKVGVDLQFRNINAASARISVVLDAGNNEVDLDVVEVQINHNSLGGLQGGQANQYYHLTTLEHGYISGVNAQSLLTTASPYFVQLGLLDTGVDHELYLKCNENLSADRILNLIVGDVERTITLGGNPTLADWFDQSVKQAASPTFVNLILAANGAIKVADGNPQIIFDNANNWLEITGRVGIGDPTPAYPLTVHAATNAYIQFKRTVSTTECGFILTDAGVGQWYIYMPVSSTDLRWYWGADRMKLTATGHLHVFDWDDAVLREVSFGADDSGGAGFKVLRVPN